MYRPSVGSGVRRTQPRRSSRPTTWDRRDNDPSAKAARSLIRRVRSGDIDSPASTWYSKWLMPASRCSCASSAEGRRMNMLASASHACISSSESQGGSDGASMTPA